MLDNVEVYCQSSIKIKSDKIIYFDPYKITKNSFDADLIFITHDHYDHFSKEDIEKVRKKETKIIGPLSMKKSLEEVCSKENLYLLEPMRTYNIEGIKIETIPSYNINKDFHPKENNWLGYIITINNIRYFIAGDTDITEEDEQVKCDVSFLPIGGTYTMTYQEAVTLTNKIKPQIVVPIHYKTIVGTLEDAKNFKEAIDKNIQCIIMYE